MDWRSDVWSSDLAKYGWRTADRIWRLAGDHATDFNHYSKRIILAGVYAATLLVFLDDESEGERETRGFLARRIDGIIRFERAKHRWQERRERRPRLSCRKRTRARSLCRYNCPSMPGRSVPAPYWTRYPTIYCRSEKRRVGKGCGSKCRYRG